MSERILDNLNIRSQELITTPKEVRTRYPVTESAQEVVWSHREIIRRILTREDHRAFAVVGPCSVHDLDAAMEYAKRLRGLADELQDTMVLIMRVYFEKPRTSIGWKGFLNDPFMDDSFRIGEGLMMAREFLIRVAELGLAIGTEALDPITPQYIADLISWAAIGARTTESQTHREMASGLSPPIGFKNGTDGNVDVAINALKSATRPHSFLGVTAEGQCAIFHTKGNPYGHIILRGGSRPNYDSVSVAMCEQSLTEAKLRPNIVIDCSHGNNLKRFELQPVVLQNCVHQIRDGNRSIVGVMMESNLEAGRQDIPLDKSQLKRGVSVTDPCIDWETTEAALRTAAEGLRDALERRASTGP
jgi:3-deoxy-7-phosphoheptulonate synthase